MSNGASTEKKTSIYTNFSPVVFFQICNIKFSIKKIIDFQIYLCIKNLFKKLAAHSSNTILKFLPPLPPTHKTKSDQRI